jgi:predicted signal transduction protein with EAL and GGDEF domain
MVALAKRKGMSVCAEGIEHPAQAAAMAKLGVECGQGYLWSQPLEPEDAFALAALDSCPERAPGVSERLAARRAAPAPRARPAALLAPR